MSPTCWCVLLRFTAQAFYLTFWLQVMNTTLFTDVFIRFIDGDSIADSIIISVLEGNPNVLFTTVDVWVPIAIELNQLDFPTPEDENGEPQVRTLSLQIHM